MSAIWGFINFNKDYNIPENINTIFESTYQSKCKLDRYESLTAHGAYIGCGLQYITPQSHTEVMPILNKEKGIIFVADCILDNRSELISLLASRHYSSHELASAADGTLMYYAYLCFGDDCASHFRGLFSIVIWEFVNKSLTLISDHVSSRCLYYTKRENQIAFSTLSAPLLKLYPDIKPNINYYKDFLMAPPSTIYVVPGETPYEGISLMPPATCLKLTADSEERNIYWNPFSKSCTNCKTPDEYGSKFLSIYKQCVKDSLRTSGEIGIAMSSGLDSSSIGALAATELAKQNKSLYSYTFKPYQSLPDTTSEHYIFDETTLVKDICKMYSNIHPTFLNNDGKNHFEDLDFCSQLLEMPYKTGTFSNHYEMCIHGAQKGCKIFLNGSYGNNTVSYGYIQHILYHLYCEKKYIPLVKWLFRYAKHEKLNRIKLFYRSFKDFSSRKRLTSTKEQHYIPANSFLKKTILNNYNMQERLKNDRAIANANAYMCKNAYDNYMYSPNLLIYLGIYETKFGLATGMVLRDPTKDIRILEFCHQLPYPIFAYNGTPRWLIRNQFTHLLPQTILNNWKQHGILNIDWIERIYRDWTTLKPELQKNLSDSALSRINAQEYIAIDRLRTCIEAFGDNRTEDTKNINHICAIDAIIRFLHSHDSTNK